MTVAIVNQKQAQGVGLPALLERASNALASARTSGEVLEARDMASVAYDAAKSAGRMARAKNAHDEIIGAVYRAQADAALIEARAKVRLADEYDAAQDRGEVAKLGTNQWSEDGVTNGNALPTAADIGLTRKEIYDARTLRDAEIADPGVIERAVTESVSSGKEPTKAVIKRAALKATGKEQDTPAEYADSSSFDDEEVDAQAEIERLAADNEMMGKVFDADDKLSAAMAQLKQATEENRVLRERINGLMNEKNAAVQQAKMWRNKFEKLEKVAA